jgi:hypothetical protein
MMRSLARPLFLIPAAAALALTSCLETDEKLVLNPDGSGKALVKIRVAGGPDLGIGFGEEAGKPDPGKMARDTAVGLLGGAQGVEAWSDVKYRVDDEGMTEFTGVAYFPDITKFSVGSMDSGGMSSDMGNTRWQMEEDGGVITLSFVPMAGDEDETEAEDPPEDIEAEIKKQRMEFRQAKPMMAGIMEGMKTRIAIKVAGEIEETEIFEKKGSNTATLAYTGRQMLDGMEKVLMDDEVMKKLAAEGSMDSESGDMPPEVMEAAFGGEDFRIVFKAGEPIFDYQAEMAEAKAGQSDELKELIEASKQEAEGGEIDMGGSFSFGTDDDEPAGDPDPDFEAAARKHLGSLAPSFTAKNGNEIKAVVDSIGKMENDGKEGSAEIEVSFSHDDKTEKLTVTAFFSKDGDDWEASGFSAGGLPDFLGEGLDPVHAVSAWVKKE